jgi:hypothetical protein
MWLSLWKLMQNWQSDNEVIFTFWTEICHDHEPNISKTTNSLIQGSCLNQDSTFIPPTYRSESLVVVFLFWHFKEWIRIHILAGLSKCFLNTVHFGLLGYKCGIYWDSSVIKRQSIGQKTTDWFPAKADIFHLNYCWCHRTIILCVLCGHKT